MTTLERLEQWKGGHKARSVVIDIDDGYGATCWTVRLKGQGKKEVIAAETNFLEYDSLPPHVVYVIDGNSDDDWPGLEAVINAALDRAEQLGL
jgi:hypothetical protein